MLGAGHGYSPASVVRMPQFYLLWLQLFANVVAGITIISNAVVILADLTALAPAQIAPLFGVVSIFNAVGRFFWGGISDRIGCQRTFAAMFAVQAVTLFWLCGVHARTGAGGVCRSYSSAAAEVLEPCRRTARSASARGTWD